MKHTRAIALAVLTFSGVSDQGLGMGNEEIQENIFAALAGPVMGPFAILMSLAVLSSSAASLQSTFVSPARTMLAMGYYGALPGEEEFESGSVDAPWVQVARIENAGIPVGEGLHTGVERRFAVSHRQLEAETGAFARLGQRDQQEDFVADRRAGLQQARVLRRRHLLDELRAKRRQSLAWRHLGRRVVRGCRCSWG